MRYFAGQALPGSGTRARTLDLAALQTCVGGLLVPGTFNASMMADLPLGPPDMEVEPYQLWPCEVSTATRIKTDEPGLPGWVIRVAGESYPAHFVEVISPHHIRRALKMENWPAFPVEIGLNCEETE